MASATLVPGPGRRLLAIASVYILIAIAGVVLSLVYEVGADPGGDHDLAFRRTGLAPPLFRPVVLIAATSLARARGRPGALAAAVVGVVGIACFLGGIFNLPNDLDAARPAGSPTGLTIAFGVVTAIFGIGFAALLARAEVVTRFRSRREHMEGRYES